MPTWRALSNESPTRGAFGGQPSARHGDGDRLWGYRRRFYGGSNRSLARRNPEADEDPQSRTSLELADPRTWPLRQRVSAPGGCLCTSPGALTPVRSGAAQRLSVFGQSRREEKDEHSGRNMRNPKLRQASKPWRREVLPDALQPPPAAGIAAYSVSAGLQVPPTVLGRGLRPAGGWPGAV